MSKRAEGGDCDFFEPEYLREETLRLVCGEVSGDHSFVCYRRDNRCTPLSDIIEHFA